MFWRHEFYDLDKYLMGSLKSNCNNFKIKKLNKDYLDHNLIKNIMILLKIF